MPLSKGQFDVLNGLLVEAQDVKVRDGFEPLPEGTYLCVIDDAYLTTTKETGLPMISYEFKVADEESEFLDRIIFKNAVLSTKETVARAIHDLHKFEDENGELITITDSSQIPTVLENLKDTPVIIQLTNDKKSDSQWVNILVE